MWRVQKAKKTLKMDVKKMVIMTGIILFALLAFTFLNAKTHLSKTTMAKMGDYYGETHVNPYKGFAPPADGGPYPQPHSLVHANFSWRDLEPEKGVYAFEKLEKKFKLDYWENQDVKLIFRVVLDYPSPDKKKDIPEWLYEEINQDGTWYDHEWGNGFSPNYYNKKLVNYHELLIQALADRYDDHPAIAFVQVGSLGHWGEWHTLQQDGIYIPFPKLAVAEIYAEHYVEHFNNKILLMRRPVPVAKDNNMGLYNDMFGDSSHTMDEFWKWVENGYQLWLTKEWHPSMKGYWRTAPTGGEFAPTEDWEKYFSTSGFPKTMKQLEQTHVSWLGPSSPASYPAGGKYQNEIDLLLEKMGYQFRLEKERHPQKANRDSAFTIRIKMENEGVAPFYYDWPVELTLSNDAGEIVHTHLANADIREWEPGKHNITEKIHVPSGIKKGEYEINIAIIDPYKKKPGVRFNMENERPDGRYTIGRITVV